MSKYITLISLLFLTSCMSSRKDSMSESVANNKQGAESAECSFPDFVKKFSEDSVFQKKHVKFPLEIISDGYCFVDSDSVSISFVKESEWKSITLKDSIIEDIKYIHKVNATNYIVTEWGEDTGIFIDYNFEKSGKMWILTRIEDHSN